MVVSANVPSMFDGARRGRRVIITNDGHSLSSTSQGLSSACTTSMVTGTGSSTLKARIDKTLFGDILLSACSSRIQNLDCFQQDETQWFGWYGGGGNYHTGTASPCAIALGQPWQTGDIIHLTVDPDRHSLTGRHEGTGAMETICNVTGNLY